MKLELCGYFDHNFGDDYMQKITAHYMPEYDFYVTDGPPVSPILLDEQNVHIKSVDATQKLPKLLVIGSGFMVNSRKALTCELVWFLKSKHIADFCAGCSMEPFYSKLAGWLVAQRIKKSKFVICRDQKSLMWLRENCPGLKTVCMPDILFAIPDAWLPAKTNEGRLGISLLHRDGDAEATPYYTAMADAADFWIEETGKGVVLMAFDTGQENDVFSCECVKKRMQHQDRAEIVKHGGCSEILNAYALCDKVIGARFHSAVLAIKMGIDFYPVAYREKMRNLLSDIQYPVKGCDISNIDTESIKCFLRWENINFHLDRKYEVQARESFSRLKKHIREELK